MKRIALAVVVALLALGAAVATSDIAHASRDSGWGCGGLC